MAPTSSSKKRKARKVDKADKVASSLNKQPSSKSPKSPKRSRDAPSSVRVEVAPNDPAHDPIVVSFPRGIPSSAVDEGDESNGAAAPAPPRFTCSRFKPNSSRGRRVSGEDDNCAYSAAAAGRGHDARLTKAYVCVYDRKKGTLRLIPAAEKGTVFALEQAVKGYAPNVRDGSVPLGRAEDGEGNSRNVVSASDRVRMLVESFGSKKKQKVMASRAANQVNIHSAVGAGDVMMKSMTRQEGISMDNKTQMEGGTNMVNANDAAYEQARKKMLPPYDASADAPCKVYDAQAIAGAAAWDKVSRIVDKVLAKLSDGVETDHVAALLGHKGFRPPSVVELLGSIDPEGKGSPYRIKVAFFLALTLKFHGRINRGGIVEGASLDDCISAMNVPHDVGARLFELFTSATDGEEGGYVASRQQKSKMTSHVLVLYMIASGKEMMVPSIDQLCKDMKLDARDASLVLREAGFAVKRTGAGGMGVSLSVPLKFPPPRRGKRS